MVLVPPAGTPPPRTVAEVIGEVDVAPAPRTVAPRRTGPHSWPTATRLVAGFTAAGVLVTLGLAVVIGLVARERATVVAIDQVAQIATATAHGVVEPRLTDGLLTADPMAVADVDAAVRSAVLGHSLVGVTIWDADGRIVYSDDPGSIGQRFDLDAGERRALTGESQEAGVTESGDGSGRALEVYTGVRTTSGVPLLYEAYFRYDAVVEAGWDAWRAFAPWSVGALLVLELVQIPLAVALARRLQRRDRQRERLLRHAVDASTAERRRIAQDLHDGVVQELTGITYGLDASRMAGTASAAGAAEAAGRLRESIGSLRTLLVDIYPPNLAEEGLGSALGELAAGLRRRGPEVVVGLEEVDEVGPGEAALLYRAAQEAVRNIANHAGADRVELSLIARPGMWHLVVIDDGRGFDADDRATWRAAGHFGLRAIADLVDDAGGTVAVHSTPGSGTRVEVEVPRA